MTLNNEQLRLGIIEKLKECNAYIDNELPDYIMVMLVNKKTFLQISNDLKLFLGDHTPSFINWLQEAVANGGSAPKKTTEAVEKGTQSTLSKTDSKSGDGGGEDTAQQSEDSPSESSSKRGGKIRRNKSEDELELHPALDWEEEREGGRGKASRDRHRGSGVVGKLARKGSGGIKVARTEIEGVREVGEGGRERRKGGEVGGKVEQEDITESLVKPTRPIKLSKSDDLRVLIARKKGERSAPPTYLSCRRYSHSGSEGEEEEEEGERGREGGRGRRGGLSSVVKVPERTHLSIVGGGRMLARAIKGLGAAPPPHHHHHHHDHSRERGRGGGREERGRGDRGRREVVGTRERKRKGKETHVEVVPRVKRAAVEKVEEEDIREEIEGQGEMERGEKEEVEVGGEVKEDDDILPLTVEGERKASEKAKEAAASDETTRKVELAVITALRKVLPGEKELTDLRQLINQQRESKTSTHSSRSTSTTKKQETQFVVTMDRVDERYTVGDEGEQEEEGGEEVKERGRLQKSHGGGEGEPPVRGGSGMPERCRFWPNCKKAGSCPFHHPSAQCRTFPNCKYGNKCLFIHPQCKFDSRCTRSDCPYLHTAPRHVLPRAAAAPPPAFAPPPPAMMKFPGPVNAMWSPKTRFPSKSALTWTPASKTTPTTHISQRKFAVQEEETTSMAVK